jgi:hypothetical protein
VTVSIQPDTIAIRHKPFVKRVIRHARREGQKTLSKVVQRLAEERLAQLEGEPTTLNVSAAVSSAGDGGGREASTAA